MVTVRHTYLSMGGCWDLVLGWGNKDSCSSESIVSCIWLRFSTVKIPHRKHISSLKIHQKLYKCTCIHLLSIKDLKLILTAQFSDTPTPFYFICVRSTFIIYTWKYKLSHWHSFFLEHILNTLQSYTFFLKNNNKQYSLKQQNEHTYLYWYEHNFICMVFVFAGMLFLYIYIILYYFLVWG